MADFILHVIKMNVLSAVIIFIVLAVSKLLDKKYSSRWKYVIWLVISVFLLIPAKLPSPSKGLIIEVPRQITRTDSSADTTAASDVDIPAGNTENNVKLQTDNHIKTNRQDTTGQNSKSNDLNTIAQMIAIIWGAGICIAVVFKVLMMRTGKLILHRWRIPFTDRESITQYKNLCEEMHIKKAPKLVANSRLSGPLLAGIWDTYLYLPTQNYTRDEYGLIFRHELSHYRSKDLWYKMLMLCVTIVYWFNPAVYFMKKEAERDIEFLCDEAVIKGRSHEDKLQYNQLLLKTAALDRHPYDLSTSLNDGLLTFKKRMVNIMKAGKMKRGILPVICFTVILIMSNVFTGCSLKDSGEKQKKADTEASADSDASKEDKDKSDTVLKGNANTDSKEKTDTPAQSEKDEKTEDAAKSEQAKTEERTELSGYMSKDSLPTMVQKLGLQQGESLLFGDSGVRYEKDGIFVEWYTQPLEENSSAPITLNCENDSSVSMYGIYCGKNYKEVESELLQSGYRALGNVADSDQPEYKGFILDGVGELITLGVSDNSIISWSWVNWPQGDYRPFNPHMPAYGDYSNASEGEYATIKVSVFTDDGFYFSIYKNVEGQGEQLVFMENLATFEDLDTSIAVFHGQQYTLTFDCSESGVIRLSGFDEATALGDTFRLQPR